MSIKQVEHALLYLKVLASISLILVHNPHALVILAIILSKLTVHSIHLVRSLVKAQLPKKIWPVSFNIYKVIKEK